ncbi:MAG: hypothetical protein WAO52_01695 [Prolixibacteraceae bacterium]
MKQFIFILTAFLFLISCSRNPLKISVSGIDADLKIKHLDVDLLNLEKDRIAAEIPDLRKSYGEFLDIFTYRMIAIGGQEQENFPDLLYSFISDPLISKLKVEVAEKVDTVQLRENLTEAFKHFKYYFPGKQVPAIYTCISGFNQSVVTSENLIGISLDKYLGSQSAYYGQLGLPAYKRKNMNSENIVPEVMYAWAVTEWPKSDNSNNLLSQIIQEGKMMYFVDAMLPELDDSLKIGYTEKQLEFCRKGENSMWTYLAEHKLLFSSERMSVKRYIDDGPFTSTFSEASPARTGVWLGWQIIRAYMKNNPKVKLADLLGNSDFQGILNQSGYQP